MPRRDSDSGSERGDSHRRTTSKRTKKDSSSDSHEGGSDSSTNRKHRHRSSRHNSRSRSRSRESRRKERKRSRSPKRTSKHSNSVSRYSRSRSRSSSRSRARRNRRSRSASRGAKGRTKRHRRSVSRSRSKSPKSKSSKSNTFSLDRESDKLKRKVQQALKAAANADAELREKGLLSGESATTDFLGLSASTTFSEQLRRVQTLEEINAPAFIQQTFLSSRSGSKSAPKTSEEIEKDAHSVAIFGMGTPKMGVTSSDASMKKLETWKDNPEMLIHQSLFSDQEEKQERWARRLLALRKKLLLGEG